MNQSIENQEQPEPNVPKPASPEDRPLTDAETEAVAGGGWWDDGPMPDSVKRAHEERWKA